MEELTINAEKQEIYDRLQTLIKQLEHHVTTIENTKVRQQQQRQKLGS